MVYITIMSMRVGKDPNPTAILIVISRCATPTDMSLMITTQYGLSLPHNRVLHQILRHLCRFSQWLLADWTFPGPVDTFGLSLPCPGLP